MATTILNNSTQITLVYTRYLVLASNDGRLLRRLHKRGQQVHLQGFNCPVWVSWFYLKRHDGKREKRFVLSTRPMKASTINWWGKRRWQIEGWFKTAKHRFGLHRFGQGTSYFQVEDISLPRARLTLPQNMKQAHFDDISQSLTI